MLPVSWRVCLGKHSFIDKCSKAAVQSHNLHMDKSGLTHFFYSTYVRIASVQAVWNLWQTHTHTTGLIKQTVLIMLLLILQSLKVYYEVEDGRHTVLLRMNIQYCVNFQLCIWVRTCLFIVRTILTKVSSCHFSTNQCDILWNIVSQLSTLLYHTT